MHASVWLPHPKRLVCPSIAHSGQHVSWWRLKQHALAARQALSLTKTYEEEDEADDDAEEAEERDRTAAARAQAAALPKPLDQVRSIVRRSLVYLLAGRVGVVRAPCGRQLPIYSAVCSVGFVGAPEAGKI